MKHVDTVYKVYPKTGGGRNFKNTVEQFEGREYRTADGLVETVFGVVIVWSSCLQGKYGWSGVEIIKDGKVYRRIWRNKAYTARGLVTKAKQFANEVFSAENG